MTDTQATPSVRKATFVTYSADGEDFRFQGLGELIDHLEGDEELVPGRVVYVGDAVQSPASSFFDIDRLEEDMAERAYDEAGEHADVFPNFSKEQSAELSALICAWLDQNTQVHFWSVTNVREYALTADDLGNTPATPPQAAPAQPATTA